MNGVEIINKPDESTVNDSKKFTGVIPYNVIAINPTKDELHELGLTFIKAEPKYQFEFQAEDSLRKSTSVEFWLKSVKEAKHPDLDMVLKLQFFISNDVFASSNTDKVQYVNKYGRTAWAADPADLKLNPYYIDEESRQAHRGEEDLYKFLFAWLNMTYDAERKILNPCRIDVSKIFTGDFTELQSLVPLAQAYVVKVLTGVRKFEGEDGSIKYFPTAYNKYFLKHNQRSVDTIKKFINKNEYNEFKDAAYYTFNIEEFNADAIADAEPARPSIPVGNSDPF
jgi:hypothetical protein